MTDKLPAEKAAATSSGWSVIDIDSHFFWGVGRPMTNEEEKDAAQHGVPADRPMSILGIAKGIAAVEGKKHAHMIAAAPEMLAACEATMELMENLIRDRDVCQLDANNLWCKVRAAIAKATGQNEQAEARES